MAKNQTKTASKKSETKTESKASEVKPQVEKAAKKSAAAAPVKEETKIEPKPQVERKARSTSQAVVIAMLATFLFCLITVLIILFCTGIIKFSSGEQNNNNETSVDEKNGDDQKDNGDDGKDSSPQPETDGGGVKDNPYPEPTAKNGKKVEVGDLEFYLPYKFKAGGKNKDGAYTYNLEDDDGWAQVLVYAEKSSLTPTKYLQKISSYLEVTDSNYKMNGTSWVQAENAVALAYATKLDGKIYAVYYSVKLDSTATSEAMQMIPKTLYMKKIEQD